MATKVFFQPTPKQDEFIQAAFSGLYRVLLYGGAIRGGKTYVGLAILLLFCRIFPGSRWAVVRTDRNTLKKNVLPAYFKIRPIGFEASFNYSELTATMKNGSQILFVPESFQDDPELDKFKGFEANGFLLEEMNELQEKTFFKCIERAGSWIMDPMPPIIILGTCNPSQTWVKPTFYDRHQAGTLKSPYYYLPAKITDNPHVPQSYLDSLKETLPEELYQRFVEGNWEASDEIRQLVPWKHIHSANKKIESDNSLITLGVDVGRYGPDKSVLTILRGPNIERIDEYAKTDTVEVANRVMQVMEEFKILPQHVGIDSVGVGAGVVDILINKGIMIVPLNGGSSPIELFSTMYFDFLNLRAQMSWKVRTDILGHNLGNLGNTDKLNLLGDIGAIWYKIKGSRTIQIEDKDEIKKRIGRSPDNFDSLMYANWMRNDLGPGLSFT
jgi:hypothetical protein